MLAFLLLVLFATGQNTIGLPDIINYNKDIYGAGSQSWDIKQDINGIMYFANNEGLLTFDGTYWKTYPLPNKTIVRSVEIGKDRKIYIGAQDEFGYFSPGKTGQLEYHSLKKLIPAKDRSFADIWDIVNFGDDIFFRSNTSIYQLSGDHITVYSTASWLFLGTCNGMLLAEDYKNDLFIYNKGIWAPLETDGALPKEALITGVVPLDKNNTLIATFKQGLFLLNGRSITPFGTPELAHIASQHIYAISMAGNNNIALATALAGCFIINRQGGLVQSIGRPEGLQNNNILSIFSDMHNNLWMGLDNGIDMVAYSQAIKHIYPQNQNESSGYAAMVYNNSLYIGTSNGLYRATLTPNNDLSFVKSHFEPVENTKGQVWNLSVVNGRLMMGHHEGAFFVDGNKASLFDKYAGFWGFFPLHNILPSPLVVAGTYQGLVLYNVQTGKPDSGTHINFESARFLTITDNNTVWVAHPYKGLYRISLRYPAPPQIKLYDAEHAIQNVNHLARYKNTLVAVTDKGFFEYQANTDTFTRSAFFTGLFKGLTVRYIKEDPDGNIWFIHEKRMGVVDMSGPKPEIIYIPELDRKMVSGFEHIYPLNSGNIFVGAEKGFYLINYNEYKRNRPQLKAQIRKVMATGPADSLLFGGYFDEVNAPQTQSAAAIPNISYGYNSFHFEYAANLYGNNSNMEYSYMLQNFDQNWAEWSKKTEKDYTNLHAGKYTFLVKARNNLGVESVVSTYAFVVLPPWYQTTWAYTLYIILFIFFNYVMYRLLQHKLAQQRRRHAEEQQRLQYLHQLEMDKTEKELVKLRNEKLEAEIAHKNTELASTAMHLVQRGELLSKVKEDLSRQMKQADADKTVDDLKRMVKALGEDERIDRDWKNFAQHFDSVHSDFLSAVKAKHPNLTANELKLCAYLRMSLASKEIAPLLNISVRGVEISRYRLRKKLQIPTEVNLFDYLLGVKGENTQEKAE